MKQRQIFFDFDGVLADTTALLYEHFSPALRRYLDPHGKIPNFEDYRREIYTTHKSTIHGWAKVHGLSQDWVLKAQEVTNAEAAESMLPFLSPHPAAFIAKLEKVAAENAVAILTQSHRVYTYRLLERVGLAHIFPQEHIYDAVFLNGRQKVREVYAEASAHLQGSGPPPVARVMLDDLPHNLAGAKEYGLETLLILPETPADALPYVDHHFPHADPAVDHLLATA